MHRKGLRRGKVPAARDKKGLEVVISNQGDGSFDYMLYQGRWERGCPAGL